MKGILARLKDEILIFDGAFGTVLQESGALKAGACPEELNISDPGIVKKIHRDYINAGADVIETNSFGASKLKLAAYGLEKDADRINYEAARIARSVASACVSRKVYVAGSVGPLDRQITPLGDLSFDEAVKAFEDQIRKLKEGGCDLIILETFADIKEVKAAVIAAKEIGGLPIQAQMTFEGGERSTYGTTPAAFAVLLNSLGADIIGTNCSTGPKELINAIKQISPLTDRFISCQPNAGLPELRSGKTYFPETPKSFAKYAVTFAKLGVNVIGGCCGTTPEHIKEIRYALKKRKPAKRVYVPAFRLSSRTKVVELGAKTRPLIIGERINPTGKKDLQEEIRQGKNIIIRREAIEQSRKGADILDVNVGVPGTREQDAIAAAVEAAQAVSEAPLSIDSANPFAVEAALKEAAGKPLINSVNGETERIGSILPLAKKYGAAILVLALDSRGIPKDCAARVKIAEGVIRKAVALGIRKEDIIVDPLTLAISAKPEQVKETLKAIKALKKKGFSSSLGVSNISFGLPNRRKINADFFGLALAFGLDLAIINPSDDNMFWVAKQKKKRPATDAGVKKFLKDALSPAAEATKKGVAASCKDTPKDVRGRLKEAVLYGDKDNISYYVEEALAQGIGPAEINSDILIPALEIVGEKFGRREYFLPQVILSAESVQRAFGRLKKEIKPGEQEDKGTIVIATVEGDIHDIGKNIVISVLENHGYKIYDLGRSVTADVIIKEAVRKKADIIGLSALMTTTMIQMERVVRELKKKGLNFKTIVGGAVVTEAFAKEIGASAYARDAIEAVSIVKSLMKERS
ncbi:MAG TPA: homocysteine S-methyltransferase family protein [Candidatus Omnitrophota bacterium]|nr:homocysteine S-methyltransferase family protein [Candidatus Omnitrophota bacterium]HPN66687.1 homocysteine S-methyltransferase family protein [Candidatus Omnitrophota bacterium]HRZ67151.1 homocysteine S-methyltransferase family protein [Candidatus Omnitrophota bacterium]